MKLTIYMSGISSRALPKVRFYKYLSAPSDTINAREGQQNKQSVKNLLVKK